MQKMLIADSSEDFRFALEELFSGSYRIKTCSTGKEAADCLSTFHPDVMILDLLLPELDGISVLHSALSKDVRPKVLATTRYVNDYILYTFQNMNVDYMMVKPCDLDALAARVADLKNHLSYPISLEDLQIMAIRHLQRLGFPSHLDGYLFLKTGLPLFVKRPHQRLFNELYAAILEITGFDNEKQVDRSICSAIQAAWKDRDDIVWQEYFKPNKTGTVPRPCNRLFFNRLTDKITEDVIAEYHK